MHQLMTYDILKAEGSVWKIIGLKKNFLQHIQ